MINTFSLRSKYCYFIDFATTIDYVSSTDSYYSPPAVGWLYNIHIPVMAYIGRHIVALSRHTFPTGTKCYWKLNVQTRTAHTQEHFSFSDCIPEERKNVRLWKKGDLWRWTKERAFTNRGGHTMRYLIGISHNEHTKQISTNTCLISAKSMRPRGEKSSSRDKAPKHTFNALSEQMALGSDRLFGVMKHDCFSRNRRFGPPALCVIMMTTCVYRK